MNLMQAMFPSMNKIAADALKNNRGEAAFQSMSPSSRSATSNPKMFFSVPMEISFVPCWIFQG
jgi:hypothetical protein